LKVHGFKEKLEEGEKFEAILDSYFETWYDIAAQKELQKLGIDRIFTSKSSQERYSVEYKSDSRAAKTENFFIETVSVDVAGKAGWALTSCAQLICFFIPPKNQVVIVEGYLIKKMLTQWKASYPTKKALNPGYASRGILVPVKEVEKLGITFTIESNPLGEMGERDLGKIYLAA